ncbi:cilia- and flagella-associated protein 100-like [Alosa sapidissima]|uniref:cilia- and flagella-associated protein 100-like n=1 Tax=Alosa sapidissima TaxID=34773 RepID=UPI001C0804B2|nr:cilia- and flagella-associated protein 100-like [Alosa sapidissima]XP_041965225.1 cilia- and flagella-associated protein 100-like [Alosa sapidissima]XP_041965226.1 cilia- and flagella-associated protein 100-like [Alosa sapidissima]
MKKHFNVSLAVPVMKKGTGKTVATSNDYNYLLRRFGLASDKKTESQNPFVVPTDIDIFKRRVEESHEKQQEKVFQSKLPVHEKTTLLYRRRCHSAPLRELREEPEYETNRSKRDKAKWTTVISNGRCKEKESIQDYKDEQKEMFMAQYALAVKKETIRKMKRDSEHAMRKMKQAELDLEEDAVAFEEFLKLNDQSSVEAVKLAEKETMAKLEKTAEIKKVTSEMMTVKSDISRHQEVLNEYGIYRKFLTALAPPEWRDEQKRKREERRWVKLSGLRDEAVHQHLQSAKGDKQPSMALTRQNSKMLKTVPTRPSMNTRRPSGLQGKKNSLPEIAEEPKYESDVFESDEEPEIYFTDLQEMLNILADLEEQNLSYIQNFQETEEATEEFRCQVLMTQKKMKSQTEILEKQIEIIQAAIEREKEKTQELQLKSKIFSFGEFRADKQDSMLDQLHKKVREVYISCVGNVDCKISTVQMLARIEHKMLEMLECLELQPQDKLKMLKAAREKETRMRLREEKARLKQQHQEERIRVALERATRAAKKWAGRKLMGRSEPPAIKKNDQNHLMTTKEQEDLLYFFS